MSQQSIVVVGGMVWGPKDAADTPIGYRLAVEMGHPATPKPIGKAARKEASRDEDRVD